MSINAYYLSRSGEVEHLTDTNSIKAAFDSGEGLLWVDVELITPEYGMLLQEVFHFHHLAVEDCVLPKVSTPKIDNYDTYLFIMANGITHTIETDIIESTQLALFLGSHFVVSTHHIPFTCVNYIRKLTEADGRPLKHGSDRLAYALLDGIVDDILPVIDYIDTKTGELEEKAIIYPEQSTLREILYFKHSTSQLHRMIVPQREVLNRLSRGEFPIIGKDAFIFYRDIYDHIVQMENLAMTLRESFDNALNIYVSSVANRQNEIMKVLSIVAAIFLPLSLIAGIYGMNFTNMPELEWPWGYFAVLGFMAVCVIGILLWYKSRGWIRWGSKK